LTALVLEPDGSGADLEDLAWGADAVVGARAPASRTSVVGERVVALVVADEPRALAEALAGAHAAGTSEVGVPLRVGIGNPAAPDAIRDSYLSAVFALRAAPEWRIASAPDLGAFDLLLGAQSRPVLQGFVRSLVGPLVERDRERSSELVPSLRAYLEAAGRWEQGAQALGIHRHTLRYRIRQAEALLGRDLSSAEDRLELWLALKALEVLDE
jgi:PucR family transcriptional regulator, purine catabolism regulatory protein